jgi:hypothetical protein
MAAQLGEADGGLHTGDADYAGAAEAEVQMEAVAVAVAVAGGRAEDLQLREDEAEARGALEEDEELVAAGGMDDDEEEEEEEGGADEGAAVLTRDAVGEVEAHPHHTGLDGQGARDAGAAWLGQRGDLLTAAAAGRLQGGAEQQAAAAQAAVAAQAHRHDLPQRPQDHGGGALAWLVGLLLAAHAAAFVAWVWAWWRQRKDKRATMRPVAPPTKVSATYDLDKPGFSMPKIELAQLSKSLKPAQH